MLGAESGRVFSREYKEDLGGHDDDVSDNWKATDQYPYGLLEEAKSS